MAATPCLLTESVRSCVEKMQKTNDNTLKTGEDCNIIPKLKFTFILKPEKRFLLCRTIT